MRILSSVPARQRTWRLSELAFSNETHAPQIHQHGTSTWLDLIHADRNVHRVVKIRKQQNRQMTPKPRAAQALNEPLTSAHGPSSQVDRELAAWDIDAHSTEVPGGIPLVFVNPAVSVAVQDFLTKDEKELVASSARFSTRSCLQ